MAEVSENLLILEEWVDALRSGKYQHCKNRLHKTDGTFDALGILLDIYDPNLWVNGHHGSDYFDYKFQNERTGSEIPARMRNMFQLSVEVTMMMWVLNDEPKVSMSNLRSGKIFTMEELEKMDEMHPFERVAYYVETRILDGE